MYPLRGETATTLLLALLTCKLEVVKALAPMLHARVCISLDLEERSIKNLFLVPLAGRHS